MPSETTSPPWWRHLFASELWTDRDFRNLWVAQTISVIGSQVTALALPLAAVLALQATATEMGVLRAVQSLPALLLGLIAGAMVDRFRRRPIMVWTDLGQALALGLVPLAAALDRLSIELLVVVGFVVGTLRLFFDVAYFSFLPAIVERPRLVEGNSKLELSSSVARIAGPTLGGVLVQLLTAPLAIALDALSFLVSALFIGRIQAVEAAPVPRQQRQPILAEIGEGLRFVLSNPILRALAAATATFNLGLGVLFTLYVLFLSQTLGLSPVLIGIISAAIGPGFLIGALLVERVTDRFGVGPAMIGAHVLGSTALLAIPAATGPEVVVILLLAGANLLNGFTGQIAMISNLSLRQQITPDRLLGRTNATMRVISWSAAPFAAVLGGAVGEAAGLRWGLGLGAGLTTLSVIWLLLSPVRRLRLHPEGEPNP